MSQAGNPSQPKASAAGKGVTGFSRSQDPNKAPVPAPVNNKRKNQAPAASSNKKARQQTPAQDQAEISRKRQAKYEIDLATALSEFKAWTQDANSPPRGQEHPSSKILRGRLKPKNIVLVLHHRGKGTEPHVITGWRLRLDLESQCTGFSLLNTKAGVEVRIGPKNLCTKNGIASGDNIFTDTDFDVADYSNIQKIQNRFRDQLETADLSDEAVQQLIIYAKIPEDIRDVTGFHCLQMVLKNQVSFRYPNRDLGHDAKDRGRLVAQELMDALNNNPVLTIVRKNQLVLPELDAYWKHRVRTCVNKRIFPFFSEVIDNTQVFLFENWRKNPDMAFPHEPWMANPEYNRSKSARIKAYASHAAKHHFDTMRQWEIIVSVALIHEIDYENKAIATYFNWGITHQARVLSIRGGYVRLEVSVTQPSDTYAIPAVAVNSTIDLRLGKKILEDDDFEEDQVLAGEDTGMRDGHYQGDQFKAKILGAETVKSFICSFVFDKKNGGAFAAAKYKAGTMLSIQLEMKRNSLPSSRQLSAIGILSNGDSYPPESKRWATYLRQILLGHGAPDLASDPNALCPEEAGNDYAEEKVGGLVVIGAFVDASGLNTSQHAAWFNIITQRGIINVIQGPPGCGKTAVNATIAVTFALLGHKTLVCAATNKACEAAMKALIRDLAILEQISPEAAKSCKLIYVPTAGLLKAQLLNPDEDENGVDANDLVDHDEDSGISPELKDYQLWTHVVKHFRKLANGHALDRTDAAAWLKTLGDIRDGVRVGGEELRIFLQDAKIAAEKVLADPEVMMVVTTSSSSDLLKGIFDCAALIIDESAFGSEQDSCVPLSMWPRWLVLTGDHQQLKPIVQSKGHNEYASQMYLSLFERVVGQPNIPVFRLQINYRMHPDIAELPGTITYKWLGCGPETLDPTDAEIQAVDIYMELWWNGQGKPADYRRWRRAPAFGKPSRQNFRRLFFNVLGGRSGNTEGSTSMVNYANVVVIVDLILSILEDTPEGVYLSVEEIKVLTPYSEQKTELQRYINFLLAVREGYTRFPEVVTIDSMQGGQAKIVILDLTAAHPKHGSNVGFMQEWNRLNVALTRAQRFLFMVGNLDAWRSELKVLGEYVRAKKMVHLIIDLLDYGDLIDIPDTLNALPEEDEVSLPRCNWTRTVPGDGNAADTFPARLIKAASDYQSALRHKRGYEASMLAKLQEMRDQAQDYQNEHDAGNTFIIPIFEDKDVGGDEGEGGEAGPADPDGTMETEGE